MGLISALGQLISSSTFNDCSVTVIYSGTIITDVLLLCERPSATSPSLLCADVIMFFRTTPVSFTVVLCIFVVSSSATCTFASVAWLEDTGHGVSWPTGLSSLTRDDRIFPPGPITAQPVWTIEQPTFNLSCFHFKSFCHLPFTSRCAYMGECEYACVQNIHM